MDDEGRGVEVAPVGVHPYGVRVDGRGSHDDCVPRHTYSEAVGRRRGVEAELSDARRVAGKRLQVVHDLQRDVAARDALLGLQRDELARLQRDVDERADDWAPQPGAVEAWEAVRTAWYDLAAEVLGGLAQGVRRLRGVR